MEWTTVGLGVVDGGLSFTRVNRFDHTKGYATCGGVYISTEQSTPTTGVDYVVECTMGDVVYTHVHEYTYYYALNRPLEGLYVRHYE